MISNYFNAARRAFDGVKKTAKQAKSVSKLIGKKKTAKLVGKRYARKAMPGIKKYGPALAVGTAAGTGIGLGIRAATGGFNKKKKKDNG